MINKLIFLGHAVVQNNPSYETESAGLGPAWIYGIILIVMIFIGIIYFIKKEKGKTK